MDEPILTTPVVTEELKSLIAQAHTIYESHFPPTAWFGRCIFLSFYCERGTCTFCFRSTQKHRITHPDKARRSLASILAEAMMIKAFGWRIEFLTGGYGILDDEELLRTIKLVSQILDEKIWVNLGEISTSLLEELAPFGEGIVSSIETVEENLHAIVCPDKPIAPYVAMMQQGLSLGLTQSMTIVIGLGEQKKDFAQLERFISDNTISRITIYALRPVAGTPFSKGPDPQDVAWWIAKTRIAFPTIEIIAGSAAYRIPEISLFLDAGANAITKLPATTIFNTSKGQAVIEEIQKANRTTQSLFTCKDVYALTDWEAMLERTDTTSEEKKQVREVLARYLEALAKKGNSFFSS